MYFCKTILSPTQFGNAIGRAIGAVYDVVYNPNYDGVNLSSLLGNMVYLQTVVQEYRTNYEEFALTQGGLKVPPSILQEPTVPTCFSPMLKTLTDTPLGTGRQLPLTNIYSRDPYDPNELWFSQLTYQDLLREVIDEDSNVISITDWPCNASTVMMDSIRDPLNKKWSWGRIARSIGTSKNDLLEPQLIKLPYRYSGVLPMTCMSVDDAQPICSLTRLVDANPTNTIEDHFIGTCESYSQAILPLLSDAELSGIDSDAVISKESRSDRNPLNYLFRINDLYGNIDSNGAVDETLPTGPVNGSLISFDPLVTAFDQIIGSGTVEGPNLLTIAALSPVTEIGTLSSDEVANISLHLVVLNEHALSNGSNAAPIFKYPTSLKGYIGADDAVAFDSWKKGCPYSRSSEEEELLIDGDLMDWPEVTGSSRSFVSRKFHFSSRRASTGLTMMTKRSRWPARAAVPSIIGWAEYFGAVSDDYPFRPYPGSVPMNPQFIFDVLDRMELSHTVDNLTNLEDDSVNIDNINKMMTSGTYGWVAGSETFEQAPFSYYHRLNVILDRIFDQSLIQYNGEHAQEIISKWINSIYSSAESFLFDISKWLWYQPFVSEADLSIVVANDKMKVHTALMISIWSVWTAIVVMSLVGSIIHLILQIKLCKKGEDVHHPARFKHWTFVFIVFNSIFMPVVAIFSVFTIPYFGEIQRICEYRYSQIMIPDEDSMKPDLDLDFRSCIENGALFTNKDFDQQIANNYPISPEDSLERNHPLSYLLDIIQKLFGYMSPYMDHSFMKEPEISQLHIPMPTPLQLYYDQSKDLINPNFRWSIPTLPFEDYMIGVEESKNDALTALDNKFDKIIVHTIRGLIYDVKDEQSPVINIGLGDHDPYLSSLIDPKLIIVNIDPDNKNSVNIDDEGLILLIDLLQESEALANIAQQRSQINPIWLGGHPIAEYDDYWNRVEKDDLYQAAGLEREALPKRSYYEYLKRNFTRPDDYVEDEWILEQIKSNKYRKILPNEVINYKDVIDKLSSEKSVLNWTTAVHHYLENLYGGPDEMAKPMESREVFLTKCNADKILDICVLGINTSTNSEVPVAGHCSLQPELFSLVQCDKPFDSDSSSTLYACIRPLRTSSSVYGDIHDKESSQKLFAKWSGLLPLIHTFGGGRSGRWLDLTCGIYCSDDVLRGDEDNEWTQLYTMLNEESALESAYWFGSVSWSGSDRPRISGHVPIPRSTINFVEYRKCIAPSFAEYPIDSTSFNEILNTDPNISDEYLRLLKFMSSVEYIQELATQAYNYSVHHKDYVQTAIAERIAKADIEKIPTLADFKMDTDTVLAKVKDALNNWSDQTVLLNEIMNCEQLSKTINDASIIVCATPSGMATSLAWLSLIAAMLFLLTYPILFVMFHYWRDRNGIDFFYGETPITLIQKGDRKMLRRLLRFDPMTIDCSDHNENTPLHWAVEMGDYGMVEDLLEAAVEVATMLYEQEQMRQINKTKIPKAMKRMIQNQCQESSLSDSEIVKLYNGKITSIDNLYSQDQFYTSSQEGSVWDTGSIIGAPESLYGSDVNHLTSHVFTLHQKSESYVGIIDNESKADDNLSKSLSMAPTSKSFALYSDRSSTTRKLKSILSRKGHGGGPLDLEAMIRRTLYTMVNLKNESKYAPIHIATLRLFRPCYDKLRITKKEGDFWLRNWFNCKRDGANDLGLDLTMWNIIDLLIDHGANINVSEEFGESPLYKAIKNAKETRKISEKKEQGLKIVEELLKRGANVTDINNTSLVKGDLPTMKHDFTKGLETEPKSTLLKETRYTPSKGEVFKLPFTTTEITSSGSENVDGTPIQMPTDLSSLVPDLESQTTQAECHPLLQAPESYEELRLILQNTLVLPHFTQADRGLTRKLYKHDNVYLERSYWDYAAWIDKRGICKESQESQESSNI